MTTPTIAQLRNLGYPVTTRQYSWDNMARQAWGTEFAAPDHNIYNFTGGRSFDSSDLGTTGIYDPNNES